MAESAWIKTSHLYDSWPKNDGPYWIVVRMGGKPEVHLAHWTKRKRAFQLFPDESETLPRTFISHFMPAAVPELPAEAG